MRRAHSVVMTKLAVRAAELASFVCRSSSDLTLVHACSDHASVRCAALPGTRHRLELTGPTLLDSTCTVSNIYG